VVVPAGSGGFVPGEELGVLVFCAMSYDRRIPKGQIPAHLWEMLPKEWKDRANNSVKYTETRWEERHVGDRE
jgi:hypothetical protein